MNVSFYGTRVHELLFIRELFPPPFLFFYYYVSSLNQALGLLIECIILKLGFFIYLQHVGNNQTLNRLGTVLLFKKWMPVIVVK